MSEAEATSDLNAQSVRTTPSVIAMMHMREAEATYLRPQLSLYHNKFMISASTQKRESRPVFWTSPAPRVDHGSAAKEPGTQEGGIVHAYHITFTPPISCLQSGSVNISSEASENDLAARMKADTEAQSSFLSDLLRPTLLKWVNYDVAHHVVPLQHALGLRVVGGGEGEVKELWRDPSQPVVKRILFFLMSIYFDVSVQTTCRG